MICGDATFCVNEIRAYFQGEPTGHFLLVNAENPSAYRAIRSELRLMDEVRCLGVADLCKEDTLPNPGQLCDAVALPGKYALTGFAQLLMLQSAEAVQQEIQSLLERPVRGHGVILLTHCERVLQEHLRMDPRTARQIVLLPGTPSPLPRIRISNPPKGEPTGAGTGTGADTGSYTSSGHLTALGNSASSGHHTAPGNGISSGHLTVSGNGASSNAGNSGSGGAVTGIRALLSWLEEPAALEIEVITRYKVPFENAVYPTLFSGGTYDFLRRTCPELSAQTKASYGTEEQWQQLSRLLDRHGSLSGILAEEFGGNGLVSAALGMAAGDRDRFWLLWMCMKALGVRGNRYLDLAVQHTERAEELQEHLVLDLLEVPHGNPDFSRLYQERKQLLSVLPENPALLERYCNGIGRYEKDGVFYLTDRSRREELEFLRCLHAFPYTQKELSAVAAAVFPEVARYLRTFVFDESNTTFCVRDAAAYSALTAYFDAYKVQKVTNHLWPEFLAEVERLAGAEERPYNKLLSRASILRDLDRKNARLFFFDALGVEYLSYFQAKCEEYGLSLEIHVGHGNLPSITACNQDFLHYFPPEDRVKIDVLDEIKHHSQKYDYQTCKLPIHLFRELEVIAEELRTIQSRLTQDSGMTAIVVSDHGASRLAVIHEQWNDAAWELDEKGEHSGRCCPVETDPNIPFATFERDEQGKTYATAANYQRFRGGRRANVEVHGGAALEEIVVPVLVIRNLPKVLEVRVLNPVMELRRRETAVLKLHSTQSLVNPRLRVEGHPDIFVGESAGDPHIVQFPLPGVTRANPYQAELYDGNRNLASGLVFRIQKKMARENDMGL